MTGSEIKVTENLGSTTFNNTLEIKKQLNVQNIYLHFNILLTQCMYLTNTPPPQKKMGENCHFNEGTQLKFAFHRLCL